MTPTLLEARRCEMLALGFRGGEYAFVYTRGKPIGVVGLAQRTLQASILFGGSRDKFEVLRPNVVARRYGAAELERLIEMFALHVNLPAKGSFEP
jgi:hypothetical protein